MSAKTKKKPKPDKSASASTKQATTGSDREQPQNAAPSGGTTAGSEQSQSGQPPPGLDQAKHARAQRAAKGAELLREGIFPALMASAVGFDNFVETSAFKVYLERFLNDLGNPKNPIERLLAEQMALLHFRVAQLHVDAAQAKSCEAIKMLNSATARLLGEFRRGALTLQALRTPPTAEGQRTKVRLFKAAQ